MQYTRTSLRDLAALTGALALIVTVALAAMATSPAFAQDSVTCEPVVDDGADIDVAQVNQTVDQARVEEVTYVVRAFGSVPGADLDAAVDQVVVACFAGDSGEMADDIIMLAVSRGDRLSVVAVGDRWGGAIPDAERERIRTDVMSPQFQQENFTGDLVDAVIAADQLIVDAADGANTTEQTTASGDSDNASDDGDTTSATNSGLSDRSTIAAVVGALALIALGVMVFLLVNNRRKIAAARQSLETALSTPWLRTGALRERFDRLTGQADVWERTTAGKTKAKLRTLMRETANTQRDAERSAALVTTTIPNGIENASMDEVRRAKSAGVALSKALEDHERELDRLTAFGAHLDHLRIALPTKKELLTEELGDVELLMTSRQSDGWKAEEVGSTLTGIKKSLRGISFDDLELDLLTLSFNVEHAEAHLFASAHHLESLPHRATSLRAWNDELDDAAEVELKRIDNLRSELAGLAHEHASSSWNWAVDNPEQALEELEHAHGLQEFATSEQLVAQEFDDAGSTLERAGLHLMQADRLLDEVDDLLVDLQQAKVETPALLAQADEILKDLTAFVASNAADLDRSFQDEPAGYSAAITGIRTELQLERPNYLRVAETLDRINRRLDETLAGARDATARMQALRREADREVARADRTLLRAERALGWEIFPSRDGVALEQLRAALNALPSNPQERIIVAANVADGALQIQERIIARRRRRTARVVTGGGGGFGGGWSSGGGSKGSSWSGGGGRSSGGRSFGGGISRGGRSFGGGRSSGSF